MPNTSYQYKVSSFDNNDMLIKEFVETVSEKAIEAGLADLIADSLRFSGNSVVFSKYDALESIFMSELKFDSKHSYFQIYVYFKGTWIDPGDLFACDWCGDWCDNQIVRYYAIRDGDGQLTQLPMHKWNRFEAGCQDCIALELEMDSDTSADISKSIKLRAFC